MVFCQTIKIVFFGFTDEATHMVLLPAREDPRRYVMDGQQDDDEAYQMYLDGEFKFSVPPNLASRLPLRQVIRIKK